MELYQIIVLALSVSSFIYFIKISLIVYLKEIWKF